MIYLPDTSKSCYVVINKDTIRGYDENPNISLSTEINYTDYFINSHYLEKKGSLIKESTIIVENCIPQNELTSAFIYRNDIHQILIITLILIGVSWFFIVSLIKVLFKGRKVF